MTPDVYAVAILVALTGAYITTVVAVVLNIRSAGRGLPRELADLYDAPTYAKSRDYTRARQGSKMVKETVELGALLLFWFLSGFAWLDALVRGWGTGPILTGLAFIGLLVAADAILSLPFAIHVTFVIEERFGFNRTTLRTFFTDRVKGALLALVVGGPLLTGVLWFLENAGGVAWLYTWAVIIVFLLIFQFVLPTWILPLFNRFTPLEEGELRQEILNYARRVRFPIRNIFVMDGSKRSSKSNAFFTGFGPNRRIALFDTLIGQLSVGELVSVLAHEIGHYKKRHVLQGIVIGIVEIGIMLFLLQFFIGDARLAMAFGVAEPSVYAGLVFFGILYTPVELLLGSARHLLSRRHEFEADRFAAQTMGDAVPLTRALKTLHAENLDNLTPHPFYVFLNYSHPPLLERVRALAAIPASPPVPAEFR